MDGIKEISTNLVNAIASERLMVINSIEPRYENNQMILSFYMDSLDDRTFEIIKNKLGDFTFRHQHGVLVITKNMTFVEIQGYLNNSRFVDISKSSNSNNNKNNNSNGNNSVSEFANNIIKKTFYEKFQNFIITMFFAFLVAIISYYYEGYALKLKDWINEIS